MIAALPGLDSFPHFGYELLRVFQHSPIGNPQQAYAESSQVILFSSVFPYLTRLRVNTAIQLDRHSMLEAVEIDNPAIDAALAAEFRAQAPVAQ